MASNALEDALESVRVTAGRVRRFTAAVERAESEEARQLWRAALADHRAAIRAARAAGASTEAVQEATAAQPTGRFLRTDAEDRGVPA